MSRRRDNHPAFTFAVVVSLTGGAAYIWKRHLPSLVGGTLLGVSFLGVGMLSLMDKITPPQFVHGSSMAMAGLISGVRGRHFFLSNSPSSAIIAGAAAAVGGFHTHHMLINTQRKTLAERRKHEFIRN